MTTQSDIKKLAEQMAGSMKSFDDIKDFQKQLMQSFIDTALEAEMEDHLGYPKHEKADKPNKRNGHTKKTVRSDTGDFEISTPRDRHGDFEPERGNSEALLRPSARQELCSRGCVSIKVVSQVLMIKSSHFMPKVRPPLKSSKPLKNSMTSTSQALLSQESRTTS